MTQSIERTVNISPPGDEGAAGTNEQPLKSIGRVLEQAKPGTTLMLQAGRYEPFTLEGLHGTLEHPIVLRGQIPPPVDLSAAEQLTKEVQVLPLRRALDEGKLSLPANAPICYIDGGGAETGLLVQDCSHLCLENLVLRDATVNLALRRCEHVTIRD